MRAGPLAVALGVLWLGAVLQHGLAHHVAVFGVVPDFLLVAMTPVAMLSRPSAALWAGFFCGIAHGAVAGANLAHYVVSRAVAALGLSATNLLGIELSTVAAGVSAAAATLGAQLLLLFLAPPASIGSFLTATIGTAMYNGVLAMPLYALLRRLFRPKSGLGI